MASAITQPRCLHIPTLCAGQTAAFSWEVVDDAVEYELEACFDASFGDTNATGKSWLSVETSDETWSQIDTYVTNWQALEAMSESHTVYKGPGTVVPSPDMGLTWLDVEMLDKTWSEHGAKNLTWIEIAMLYAAQKLSWNSLDAMFMTFDEAETAFPSWQALEQSGPHDEPHLGCKMDIPQNTRWAIFRIRARNAAGNVSSALYTSQIPVITSQTIEVPLLEKPEILYIGGEQVNRESATQYMLLYNQSLVGVMPSKIRLNADASLVDKLWSGLAASIKATSKTRKTASLRLDWNKVR